VRRARLADVELLLRWRNDPETRSNSFTSDEIGLDAHASWLSAKLAEPTCLLLVAELDGHPVGQVRLDRRADDWAEISITVAPEARGRGIGRQVIAAGSSEGADELAVQRIVARIKPDNAASAAAFRNAGYARWPQGDDDLAQAYEWHV
jgi:RimJ/RimL family protein N-acetyltransferase